MTQSEKNKKRRKVVGRVVGISVGVLLVLLVLLAAFIARVVQITVRDIREGDHLRMAFEHDADVKPTDWERFWGTTIQMKKAAKKGSY